MSEKIDLKKPFRSRIDEHATLSLIKKHLSFLSKHVFLLDEVEDVNHYVEDDDSIMNYLHYTKSVIDLHTHSSRNLQSNQLLDAIAKKDEHEKERRRLRLERKIRCSWVLQGILRLPENEKMLLLNRYVENQEKDVVLMKTKRLSNSSYYRMHRKACLHLATILDIEVYQEKPMEE